jgi:hypothetical protein
LRGEALEQVDDVDSGLRVATCACGNLCSISFWTAATDVPLSARTSTTFARLVWLASFWSCASGT